MARKAQETMERTGKISPRDLERAGLRRQAARERKRLAGVLGGRRGAPRARPKKPEVRGTLGRTARSTAIGGGVKSATRRTPSMVRSAVAAATRAGEEHAVGGAVVGAEEATARGALSKAAHAGKHVTEDTAKHGGEAAVAHKTTTAVGEKKEDTAKAHAEAQADGELAADAAAGFPAQKKKKK
jgi:hypothetical protein